MVQVNRSYLFLTELFLVLLGPLSVFASSGIDKNLIDSHHKNYFDQQVSNSVSDFQLKLMSFNLRVPVDPPPNDWDSRKNRVLSILKNYSPHVVGMQETGEGELNFIMSKTSYRLASGIDTALLYDADVLSVVEQGEFYYSDTPDDPSRRELVWGQDYFRRCNWAIFLDRRSGQKFYVYNNHLDYNQTAWQKSVELLNARVAGRQYKELPFFVVGDMNIPETAPAIAFLKSGGAVQMRDTYRDMHPIIENDSTFHGFQGTIDGHKIDFILTGDGEDCALKTRQSVIIRDKVDGHYPSDHYPIFSLMVFNRDCSGAP